MDEEHLLEGWWRRRRRLSTASCSSFTVNALLLFYYLLCERGSPDGIFLMLLDAFCIDTEKISVGGDTFYCAQAGAALWRTV